MKTTRTIQLAVVVEFDPDETTRAFVSEELEAALLQAGDEYASESFRVVKAVTLL